MAKFEILHANNSTTEVTADSYTQRDGYFHFHGWENGEAVQVMSIKDAAVVSVKKID